MDSIQEAMRKLRISDTNKLRNRKRKKGLVEGVTATRSKLKKIRRFMGPSLLHISRCW